MMVIDNKYEIGQEVYLKTDVGQKLRIITAIIIRPNGCYCYEVACGSESRWHYDFELSEEKNVVITSTN